jgi:hypothetical protein
VRWVSELIEGLGEVDLAFQDLIVDVHGVLVGEGVDTREHLVEEDAECPPVDGLSVAFVEEHFGGEVLGGPTERVGAALADLGEAEVGELEVAGVVDEEVFGLEVATN